MFVGGWFVIDIHLVVNPLIAVSFEQNEHGLSTATLIQCIKATNQKGCLTATRFSHREMDKAKEGFSFVNMLRSLLRNCFRLLMACVLLALGVCAVEVWLRWERVHSTKTNSNSQPEWQQLVRPSSVTWLDVQELFNLDMNTPGSTPIQLRTNEYGLRGASIPVPKPKGTYRVLCIGGDDLFGWGRSEEQTMCGHLQRLFQEANLHHVEFLNAGVPKGGPLIHYLRIRSKLFGLEPDLVILFLSEKDLQYDQEMYGALALDESGRPVHACHPARQTAKSSSLVKLRDEFETINIACSHLEPMLGLNSPRENRTNGMSQASFRSLLWLYELAQANEGRFIISLLPDANAEVPQEVSISKTPAIDFEQRLHEFFLEQGIPSSTLIHSSQSLFQTLPPNDVYSEESGELTDSGTAIYSRTVAKVMVDLFPQILNAPQQVPDNVAPSFPTETLQPSPVPLTDSVPDAIRITR